MTGHLTIRCGRCKGKGRTGFWRKRCDHCSGKGWVTRRIPSLGPDYEKALDRLLELG